MNDGYGGSSRQPCLTIFFLCLVLLFLCIWYDVFVYLNVSSLLVSYRDSTLDRPRRRAKLRLMRRLSDDAWCCRRRPPREPVVLTLKALSELRRVADVPIVEGRAAENIDTGLRGGVDSAASARSAMARPSGVGLVQQGHMGMPVGARCHMCEGLTTASSKMGTTSVARARGRCHMGVADTTGSREMSWAPGWAGRCHMGGAASTAGSAKRSARDHIVKVCCGRVSN